MFVGEVAQRKLNGDGDENELSHHGWSKSLEVSSDHRRRRWSSIVAPPSLEGLLHLDQMGIFTPTVAPALELVYPLVGAFLNEGSPRTCGLIQELLGVKGVNDATGSISLFPTPSLQ